MIRAGILTLVLWWRLVGAQPAPAQLTQPNSWAGRRIVSLQGFGNYFVTGKDGKPEPVNPDGLGVNIVTMVHHVEGERVWIKANGAGDAPVGWIKKEQVILLEESVPYFTALIDRDGQDWDAYLRRAESEHAQNQREAAIQDYTRAIKFHPRESFLYLRRGRTYRTMKACSQAAADFQQAALLRPQWAEPYNLSAGVLVDCPDPLQRDYEAAITLIKRAVALDDNPTYLTVLALAYFRSGKVEEAVSTQRNALVSKRFPPGYREEATKQLREYERALSPHH